MKKNKFFLCIFLFTSQLNTQESICDQQCINRIQLFLDAQFIPQFKNFLNLLFKVNITMPQGATKFVIQQSGALLEAFSTILGINLPNTIDDSKNLPLNTQVLKNNFDAIYQAATEKDLPASLMKFEVKAITPNVPGTIVIDNQTNIQWKGILSSGRILDISKGKNNYNIATPYLLLTNKPKETAPEQLLYNNDTFEISPKELKNKTTNQTYPFQAVGIINTLNTY
jgi:hypothetical protein